MFIGRKVVFRGKTYDNYFATEEGFIYSLKENRGKVSLTKIGSDGSSKKYPKVNIQGINANTHSVIAETFLGDPTNVRPADISVSDWKRTPASVKKLIRHNAIHVDHINGITTDNRVSNLQYLLSSINIAKGGAKKTSD